MEIHTTSHNRTRLKGDSIVNNAVNCTLNREGSWTTKGSTADRCEEVFMNARNVSSVDEDIPEYTRVADTAKKLMKEAHQEECLDKVKSLVVQGKTLELALAEKTDFTWKSFLYDLKSGTLKFLANALIDTLPTSANLKRWKKIPIRQVQTVQG